MGKTTSRNWTTQRFGGREKRDPGMYYRVVYEDPSPIFSAIGGLLFAKKPSLPSQNHGEIEKYGLKKTVDANIMPRNLFLKFHWLFGKNDSLK